MTDNYSAREQAFSVASDLLFGMANSIGTAANLMILFSRLDPGGGFDGIRPELIERREQAMNEFGSAVDHFAIVEAEWLATDAEEVPETNTEQSPLLSMESDFIPN